LRPIGNTTLPIDGIQQHASNAEDGMTDGNRSISWRRRVLCAHTEDTPNMKNRLLLTAAALAALLLTPALLSAQARTVTGRVTSDLDGQAVPAASVRLKGSLLAASTDATGEFRIEVPAASSEILTFSHEEHDYLELDIAGQTSLSVQLRSSMRFNQYGVKVDRTPLEAEERGGMLVFENRDKTYRFWFDVRAQIDGAVFMGDVLNPIGNGAGVRRARMAMKAQLKKNWYGELDMDFADSRADLKDAYVAYTNGPFMARVGNFKETFSMETNTTSRYLVFLERPMSTTVLTPSRHLGFQVGYDFPHFLAVAGVHFQDVGDWEVVQARKDNNSAFGRSEGYSFTGKLVHTPWFNNTTRGLHLGVAGSYRTPKTTDRLDAIRFDVRTNTSINRRKYLDTDRISDVGHYRLGGAEAAAYYGPLRLQGEYNVADVRRTSGEPKATFDGYYAMGSLLLFGGRHVYNSGEGEFTQPTRGRSWGDVELAVRYAFLDLNDSSAGIMGGSGESATIGLNYYVNNNVKLMLNYGINNHDRYANGRGRLFVGRDAAGNPTTNPQLVVAPDGKAGEDFRMLSARFEVNF
jgi:phosphate-selective porin OprO and OprP